MKKIVLIVAMFLISIPTLVYASGVIVDVKGDVKATPPGGKPIPVKSGLELVDGTTVTAAGGASVSVLLPSGAIDEVAGGKTYKVGDVKAASKRTEFGKGLAVAMNELSSQGKGPTVAGMVREATGPSDKVRRFATAKGFGVSAIYPRGTAIKAGREIVFKWEASPPVNWPAPVIVIEDTNKARVAVVDIGQNSSEQKVAADKVALKKGTKYTWYLATKEPEVKGKTMRFEFKTLNAAEEGVAAGDVSKIKALGMSADGTELLVAQAYYKNGMVYEMVDTLLGLWARNKAPFVKKLIWLGYTKMNQTEKAHEFDN